MIRLALIYCNVDTRKYVAVASRLHGAQFTAVADPGPQRCQDFADDLSAPIRVDDLDALLAAHAGAFDAVVIQSPNDLHQEDAMKAAAAGKHVLVHAPLALTTAGAGAVVAACRAAGVRLMVGSPFQFAPAVQAVKQSLEAGQLGKPGLLRIHCWEPEDVFICGEVFVNKVVVDIEFAIEVFGGLPEIVFGVGRHSDEQLREGANYVQLHLGFPDGGMALIDRAPFTSEFSEYFSLSLIGSQGAAYADDHHNMNLVFRDTYPAALTASQGALGLLAQLQEFVTAIGEKREPAVTGADGYAAVLVAEAATASAASNRALRLVGDRYEPV